MFDPDPRRAAALCHDRAFVTFGSLGLGLQADGHDAGRLVLVLRAVPAPRAAAAQCRAGASAPRELLARLAARASGRSGSRSLGGAAHAEFLRTYDAMRPRAGQLSLQRRDDAAEALWQGVPVLTTYGDRWAARTSRSILKAAGLGDWVAPNVPALAALTVPGPISSLAALRASQRARIAAIPACYPASQCRDPEASFLRKRPVP